MHKPIRTCPTIKLGHKVIALLLGVMVACVTIIAYLDVQS